LSADRVVLPDAERPAAIHIKDGVFRKIAAFHDVPAGVDVFEAGDRIVAPGLVDTHVHINEPGRTDWEGFDTGTRAAAAGGITTIVDMPLNSIPATTTTRALDAKRRAARDHCHVDVAFWGGVVPGNTGDLDGLIAGGVRGFKCFLVASGVEEFPAVGEDELRMAMPTIAKRNVPLLVHAESPEHLLAVAGAGASPGSGVATPYPVYLASRPPEAEAAAIR
jgi:allantoinase